MPMSFFCGNWPVAETTPLFYPSLRKIFNQNNFVEKNIWSKKNFGQTNLVEKIYGPKFLVRKIVGTKVLVQNYAGRPTPKGDDIYPPPLPPKIVRLELCWVDISFICWGNIQNFRVFIATNEARMQVSILRPLYAIVLSYPLYVRKMVEMTILYRQTE